MCGLSVLFSRFMPSFVLEGQTFDFQPIDPRFAIAPLILLPFASTIQLVFHGMPFLRFGTLLLGLFPGMYLGIIWWEDIEFLVNPLSILILLVVSWGIFLVVLRRVCSKWSLVGQGRLR